MGAPLAGSQAGRKSFPQASHSPAGLEGAVHSRKLQPGPGRRGPCGAGEPHGHCPLGQRMLDLTWIIPRGPKRAAEAEQMGSSPHLGHQSR